MDLYMELKYKMVIISHICGIIVVLELLVYYLWDLLNN